MTKAVLRPFLVMIGVAALLWCAAMTIHLANADASTGIAPPGQGRSEAGAKQSQRSEDPHSNRYLT
jgi:hypothetical protein